MQYPKYIKDNFVFPEFYHIKINHPDCSLKNPKKIIKDSLDNIFAKTKIKYNDKIGIGLGSRGISNISFFVNIICKKIMEIGAKPFIIPAMGSHGNATAKGQKKVLETLGITQNKCLAPIISSMDVKKIGKVMNDVPVYYSKDALNMDHSICINRIKPHTKFKGHLESGIYKMLCVGMGKHKGALVYHNMALKYGFYKLLKAMGDEIIKKTNFRFSLGIVEDFYKNTMDIQIIKKQDTFLKEKQLLKKARKHFPFLPFKNLDVLIIYQIGKQISGAGMDPNITGRAYDLMEDDFSKFFKVTRIVILNLLKQTLGNGIGLGNADIITDKVYKSLDYEATLMNALTSCSLRKAFIPVKLKNDKKAIQAGFTTLGPINKKDIRAVIIKDTLHTTSFWATKSLLPEINKLDNGEILEKKPLVFNANGNINLF